MIVGFSSCEEVGRIQESGSHHPRPLYTDRSNLSASSTGGGWFRKSQLASSSRRDSPVGKNYWEACPFHESGRCPQQATVNRLLVVPQFLSAMEIETATTTCETCEKRLGDRRRHRRVRRSLSGVILSGEEVPTEVNILDLSEGGVLVRLKDRVRLREGEKVRLVIYFPRGTESRSSFELVRVDGLIKRNESAKWELAIAFLAEADD
jgi:predicted DNA-binding antitoxin AbrB/MazE fold protein